MNEKDKIQLPHNVIMEDRKTVSITGVNDVDSFDESMIIAFTDLGELTVKGVGLHITKLTIETGELALSGEIQSLVYTNDHPQKQGNFFSRVFR